MSASSNPFPAMMMRRYTSSSGSRKWTSQVATTGFPNFSPSSTISRLMFRRSSSELMSGVRSLSIMNRLFRQGLDLVIVIKIRKPRDLLRGPLLQDRLIEFPRLAGAADQKPFPVLVQKALRDPGPSGIIGHVGTP